MSCLLWRISRMLTGQQSGRDTMGGNGGGDSQRMSPFYNDMQRGSGGMGGQGGYGQQQMPNYPQRRG